MKLSSPKAPQAIFSTVLINYAAQVDRVETNLDQLTVRLLALVCTISTNQIIAIFSTMLIPTLARTATRRNCNQKFHLLELKL
jgi:hypothetical protein